MRSFSLRLAGQQVPGAFDVCGGERLAVVPFDALAQREGQLGAVLVPRPARRQIRHDRLQAGLRHVLLVHDEIVEDLHHRLLGRACRFLEDRHARRAVEMRQSENAALLLGEGRPRHSDCRQERAGRERAPQIHHHSHFSGYGLIVEPDVFHAPAVVDAVGHQCQALDPGLPAGGAGRVVEDRPDPRLGEICARSARRSACASPGRPPSIAGRPACRTRGCSSRHSSAARRTRNSRKNIWSGIVDAALDRHMRRRCKSLRAILGYHSAVSTRSSSASM